MPLLAFYTDCFVLPLPETHKFPMTKYSRLRERLTDSGLMTSEQFRVPAAATDDELRRVHTAEYLENVVHGRLTRPEVLRLGFPWSPELVERSRRSVGATIEACRAALRDGCAFNLAGGTHHAWPDAAEGYCVFNDAVVAARTMQAEGLAERVVVVDCDVHQGNGTAACATDDETIFTFSVHGDRNFPARKVPSDLDVPLADGTDDVAYLDALRAHLPKAVDRSGADLAVYLAGADPFEEDRLGRLAVSKEGLVERDRLVFDVLRERGIPVAVAMAGGYAPNVEDTVDVHFATIRTGVERLG